jgi:uroporphyrinogen decarboxylase
MDRVLRALQGQPQPHRPFTLTLSLYGARLTGCPLTDYYRQPSRYVEGQDAVMALCAPDILFAPFSLTLEAEAFGSELKFLPNNPPNVKKPAFRSADALLDQPNPTIDDHQGLCYLRECTKQLSARYRNSVPVCALLTAAVDLPAIILGIDQWLETLLFAPDKARRIIDKTTSHFAALANALLADGASFIGVPTMFTNPRILYPHLIDEIILPALATSFCMVQGPIVFHHGGNPMASDLTKYAALPNVAGFALDHRDSLAKARTTLGPDRLILGNLNGLTLGRIPEKTVIKKVLGILEDRKDDPSFIFATANADIPLDTPPEILKAISLAIRNFNTTS